MNGSPEAIAGLNDLPVRTSGGTTTYLRDVAYVRDGFSPQTNIVRQDGERGVLLSVLKNGGASTLDIVANLRALLPRVQRDAAARHQGARRCSTSRCSSRRPSQGVVFEALIAAGADGAMVLLFLGNWRSTLIIALTIPLSILASILVLLRARRDAQPDDARRPRALGRHPGRPGDRDDREHRAPPAPAASRSSDAIMVGAGEIGVPAFVSTLCICIVFVPMFFLSGVAALPVRAAGRGGGVRDARLLHPVAHAGADAGDAADARRARQGAPAAARAEPAAARLPRLRPPLRARARAPTPLLLAALLAQARRASRSCFLAFCRAVVPALPGARPRLLPHASTPARSACTCAPPPAPASRRPRASPTRSRRRSAS